MRWQQITFALLASLLLTGWGVHDQEPEWPHSGPMPDNPVKVKPLRYEPITKGTQSYRPIEPMPWGDVNRRVAPPGSLPGGPPAKKGSAAPGPAPAQAGVPVAPKVLVPTPPVTPALTPAAPFQVVPVVPTPMPIQPVVPPAPPSGHGNHGSQPATKP